MITEVLGTPYEGRFLSDIEHRKERIKDLLNKKEVTEEAKELKSKKSKSPFERLTTSIKNSDLTIDEKKSKLHYVKFALSQMDDGQAKTFENNINTLLNLKNRTSSQNFSSLKSYNSYTFTQDFINTLKKNVEIISEKIEDLKDEIDEKEISNPDFNGYQESIIDKYAKKLNNDFDKIIQKSKETDSSINISA